MFRALCSFTSDMTSAVKYLILKTFNWSLFSFSKPQSHSPGNCPLNVSIWRMRNTPQSTLFLLSLQDIFTLFSFNFAIFSDFYDFLRSFSCPRYLFTYFCLTSINIHFNSISFLSLLTITIFSGYSIDVIPSMVLLFLRHLGYPSIRPPLERMSGLQKVQSQQELTFLAALLQWSLWCCLGFCSRGSSWGGTSACGIDGPASSGGAFPSSKALSMYPNPKPPNFISACCLIDSSLNVQDRKAGRAKCLLNQGSPASVSNILVIIAPGVIHAVVFSKIALHSRRISGTTLAARFVISICPIGSPRVAATSAAVIWIDYPFWSCFELALPIVGQHAPGQAAEFVLLLARV
nr:hypothetical protein Iba_chr05cCG11080 [Ipomoea batatas]